MRNRFGLFLLLIITFEATSQSTIEPAYPKVVGYFSIVHPIVTIDNTAITSNFSGSYTVGFPVGINILKSDKIGFSFELTPFIKSADGVDKTSNILFHPGIIFRYPKGFTIVSRLAFESAGRYGATLIFNKVVFRTSMNNYFVAVPIPIRLGDSKPASIGIALQFGITF